MKNVISPLDGRYEKETAPLSAYFSEESFFRYRLQTEAKYLIFLSRIKVIRQLSKQEEKLLESIGVSFSEDDFTHIKKQEEVLRHDVKAMEYFLISKLSKSSLKDLIAYVHFGLTSEDTNNLAISLTVKDFLKEVFLPQLGLLEKSVSELALKYKNEPMLALTHGQPALPTTMGKELANFSARIHKVLIYFKNVKLTGKINGAVGNYSALVFAYPQIDWFKQTKVFVENLGLENTVLTTQVEPGDRLAEIFNEAGLLNTILISFCQDLWGYISRGYFVQELVETEVGSSTMPQKINPINFENAEGNLQIANSLFKLFGDKIPVSRFQRDLSGSTIRRNYGVAFAHSYLAYKSIVSGLKKLKINSQKMTDDLLSDWSILGEAIQIYLKAKGENGGYEIVKKMLRGKKVDQKQFREMIDSLPLKLSDKQNLEKLNPLNYLGLAAYLSEKTKE